MISRKTCGSLIISSEIRNTWSYSLNFFQKFISKYQTNRYLREIFKRIVAPKVPLYIKTKLYPDFHKDCFLLISKMQKNIQ